jgi:hypothetical protein
VLDALPFRAWTDAAVAPNSSFFFLRLWRQILGELDGELFALVTTLLSPGKLRILRNPSDMGLTYGPSTKNNPIYLLL